jgi:hypothetical protein
MSISMFRISFNLLMKTQEALAREQEESAREERERREAAKR